MDSVLTSKGKLVEILQTFPVLTVDLCVEYTNCEVFVEITFLNSSYQIFSSSGMLSCVYW